MPFQAFYHRCLNPNCDCPVIPGQDWCSTRCRKAASYTEFDEDGPPEGSCHCGHEVCRANVATSSAQVTLARK